MPHKEAPKIEFAGQQLDFSLIDLNDREFPIEFSLRWLEECRKNQGATIVYLEEIDNYLNAGTRTFWNWVGKKWELIIGDDAGYLYAILGAIKNYPPQTNDDYEPAIFDVVPLPIFARALQLARPDKHMGHQITCPFEDLIQKLEGAFNGKVFFASSAAWQEFKPPPPRRPTRDDFSNLLRGSPQLCKESLEVLRCLGNVPTLEIDWENVNRLQEMTKSPEEFEASHPPQFRPKILEILEFKKPPVFGIGWENLVLLAKLRNLPIEVFTDPYLRCREETAHIPISEEEVLAIMKQITGIGLLGIRENATPAEVKTWWTARRA